MIQHKEPTIGILLVQCQKKHKNYKPKCVRDSKIITVPNVREIFYLQEKNKQ
jgi:hypothetical protein